MHENKDLILKRLRKNNVFANEQIQVIKEQERKLILTCHSSALPKTLCIPTQS